VSNNSTYTFLELPIHKDIYPEKGPAGGIYTGLFHSSTTKNLIMACDMPFVTVEVLENLLRNSASKETVAPVVNKGIEPLCGFYSREILDRLKALIEQKPLPAHTVVTHFEHTLLPYSSSEWNNKPVFTNINKPEDLDNIA
jgi:molybdopterin-guanine dinucleotide biosynthesis protein A